MSDEHATVSMDGEPGLHPVNKAELLIQPDFNNPPLQVDCGDEWAWVNTFCLRCKQSGMTAAKTFHMDNQCAGVVVLVHETWPKGDTGLERAQRRVASTIERLQTDKAFFNELTAPYKNFGRRPVPAEAATDA